MGSRLTDKLVAELPAPKAGNKVHYDAPNSRGRDWTPGFGVRVTAGGGRSFVLNYRTKSGRERRLTIGAVGPWSLTAARAEAAVLRRRIDQGEDPLGVIRAGREAPTIADLSDRFIEEFLPRKRPATQRDYKAMLTNDIVSNLGSIKVADVTYADIDRLHRTITKRGATYKANRVVAVVSKMLSLAIRWHYRSDNPAKGIKRNPEQKRQRYLSGPELQRLTTALAAHNDQQASNIFRLLMTTGCRRGEAQAAKWEQFDLAQGIWTKPASVTKQAALHRIPLNGPARMLLAELHKAADDNAVYLFPGPGRLGHRVELKGDWAAICKAAKISGARIHDLRHTFASHLASAGQSLPLIGALLGHSNPNTTARYAHLLDDPLRAATERVGAIITGTPSAKVLPGPGQRSRR
jgi:integrase